MGFFSTLGSKISASAHSLGQKARGTVKKVGKVADTMVGAEPIAAGLLGVAATAKAVQGVSSGVSAGAKAFEGAVSVADHGGHAIDKIRKGDVMGAAREGIAAGKAAEGAMKQGKSSKKQIQRTK